MTIDSSNARQYDLVVWGASGFTGRLVAEYLLERYGTDGQLQWALGGRNRAKLEWIRDELGQTSANIPILIGDSRDPESLDTIVTRSSVVCSTVGPFARYGTDLVAACARHGTDYCDIAGEVQWMRRMIDGYEAQAHATGARIVHCCGFDSIPSDLGCLFMNERMRERTGQPCAEVKFRVRKMRGAFSGGTVASLLNVLDECRRDRKVRRLLLDPYGLNPDDQRRGLDGPDQWGPRWDADVGWTAPFVMAAINTRVVRRSNALMDYSYGPDFRYSEAVMTGRGPGGWVVASAIAAGMGGFLAAAAVAPTRALLNKLLLPQPGEGPSKEQRKNGFFDVVLVGKSGGADKLLLRGRLKGNRDPEYGATSRMLAESAVCLARDGDALEVEGGFWTPASCMGPHLIARLARSADVTFELDAD